MGLNEKYYNQVQSLQDKLKEEKQRGDTKKEIDTLFEIGKLAASAGELGFANMHFDLACRVIRNSGAGLERLHEVLGERALIFRRMKRFQESLDLYKQAAIAAQEHTGQLEYAIWIGKQGSIHRLMDKPDLAREAFEMSRHLFSKLGEAGIVGLTDQEGNLGLLARDTGDDDGAEKLYRRAVELGDFVKSNKVISTWATNLGNLLSSKRRYHEAWDFYDKAMAASIQLGDEYSVHYTAIRWRGSYQMAHQWLQSAETMINAASHLIKPELKCELLEYAMSDLAIAGAWERVIEIGSEFPRILEENAVEPKRLEHRKYLINKARENISKNIIVESTPNQLTNLDKYIIYEMAAYEESKDVQGMRDVAHLICDVNLGLMNSTEEAWKDVLSNPFLRYKVIEDAMKALCKAELPEQSLELSQRFKSLGFCFPNIQRMREIGAPNEEAAAYIEKLEALSHAVKGLKGQATKDGLQRVEAVRAIGEMLLETGEKLRNRDRILHAKLGGIVPPQDLIDALPSSDPVGLLDLYVTRNGTIVHILKRIQNKVQVMIVFSQNFTHEDALHLLNAWTKGNIPHEISDRQKEGLIEIGNTLHDKLFCQLAKRLSELKIPQVILIPDAFTRSLPIHLSFVCNEDLKQIIEKINIEHISADDVGLFSEIFPVEYAPCIQAVSVSQHQKRPSVVSSVLSLADPKSDLPGARSTSTWLASQLPESLKYTSFDGEKATLANLFANLDDSDIIIISTHGFFNSAHPNESYLEFHDGRWTMAEMLDRPPFTNSPVIILSACEIGALAPTIDELEASGIPGALISAGAACVIASLWPVEDISISYIMERFLIYLSHRGFRPAAALFRALRDLRRLTKQESMEYCYNLIKQMESDGTADSYPEQYLLLNNLVELIEDADNLHPFSSAQIWGGIVVIGSGWSLPAGALVGPTEDMLEAIENRMKRENAKDLMAKGQFEEARKILEEILMYAHGKERASTLDALAWAVWGSRQKGTDQATKQEAMGLLSQAEFLARGEQDDQLLRNIIATKKKLELYGGNDVNLES